MNNSFSLKFIFALFIFFNFVYSQKINEKILFEEKSVFWKKGLDKLVLKDGELLYGKLIEKKNGEVLFKEEFKDKASVHKRSNIRHLVLANGQTLIRNNRDHRSICYCLSMFILLFIHTISFQ